MNREPEEKPWDQRILELLPSGVDETLLAENLRLTSDERVRNMISALASRGGARVTRDLDSNVRAEAPHRFG